MRFTLSKLFLAVALIGLACAGMTVRTVWWADGIFTLSLLLYLVIALQAIRLRGPGRVFALAFSAAGIGYLLLMLTNILPTFRDAFLTNDILASAYLAISDTRSRILTSQNEYYWSHLAELLNQKDANISPLLREARHFALIGHSLWSWLFALLAGWFAAAIYARRESSATR